MKDKKILILGGSRYYSRCIEGLKDSGYFVIVADRDRNADGFSFSDAYEICDIVDEKAILRIAMKYRIDAIVPINDYGVPTASYVSSKLRISGISLETAKLSTNKEAMRKCWSESGIPCPKFGRGLGGARGDWLPLHSQTCSWHWRSKSWNSGC